MATDTFTDPKPRKAGQPKRTAWSMYLTAGAVGATTVEAALNTFVSVGNANAVQAVTYLIPKGKTLHITGGHLGAKGHATATAFEATFSLRINDAGAVVVTSTPRTIQARVAGVAVSGQYDRTWLPDGDIEITGDGTRQIGLTVNATYVTNAPTADVLLTGYLD